MLPNNIDGVEARLRDIAPNGYTLTINIRNLSPELFLSTCPEEWTSIYTDRRYALFDPVTVWCRFHEGAKRWSEIDVGVLKDVSKQVLEHAARFGLVYGAVAAIANKIDPSVKSLVSGGRSDREMTAQELEELSAILKRVVSAVGQYAGLTVAELDTLRDLASGMTHDEISDYRQISPATVKKRIERVRNSRRSKCGSCSGDCDPSRFDFGQSRILNRPILSDFKACSYFSSASDLPPRRVELMGHDLRWMFRYYRLSRFQPLPAGP